MDEDNNRLLYKKRELYRLIVARDSIHAAEQSINATITLNVGPGHPLYDSLVYAVVSSYGRAFTEMKPFGSISTNWQQFSDNDLQEAHTKLMEIRDKIVAHTDYLPEKIMIYPSDVPRRNGTTSPMVSFEVLTQYYGPNVYPLIKRLCEDLGSRLQDKINTLLRSIYNDGHALNEVTELITQADIDQLNSESL